MINVPYPSGWFEPKDEPTGCYECETPIESCREQHVTGCGMKEDCSRKCEGCREIVENDLEEAAMESCRGID